MQGREIPGSGYDSETKNKILEEATKLIALKGLGAVSMRDIAKAAGIQTSTIYYHYQSKESLMEGVMAYFENGYRHYFDWQSEVNQNAASLEEVMDTFFNSEFVEMQNPMACFGMSIAVKEQHGSVSACQRVFELFFDLSTARIQADLDRLIERGVIPPSDTKTLAMLFMFFVIGSNDLRVHEYVGAKPPVDCAELYSSLKRFFISALTRGV